MRAMQTTEITVTVCRHFTWVLFDNYNAVCDNLNSVYLIEMTPMQANEITVCHHFPCILFNTILLGCFV